MLFLPLKPNVLLLASFLAITANSCYGASSVLLNSFLPLMVRNHPEVLAEEELFDDGVFGVLQDLVPSPGELAAHFEGAVEAHRVVLGVGHAAHVDDERLEAGGIELGGVGLRMGCVRGAPHAHAAIAEG